MVIRMIFVRHAQRRPPPAILNIRVQADVVAFQRQRRAIAEHGHLAHEISGQVLLVFRAPLWDIGWHTVHGKENWRRT